MNMQRGMTLLEVMVALLLLSITGLSMLRASQQQVRNLDHLQQKRVASWVAENQLTMMAIQPFTATQPALAGESWQAGKRWYWQKRIIPTDRQGLYAIEVEVSDDPAMKAPLIRLYTWRS